MDIHAPSATGVDGWDGRWARVEDVDCPPLPKRKPAESSGEHAIQVAYGWLSKLWSLLGSLLSYGTYYFGYPKRDHNFDNYPYMYAKAVLHPS